MRVLPAAVNPLGIAHGPEVPFGDLSHRRDRVIRWRHFGRAVAGEIAD
jgi:hypothetical protein